MGAEALAQPHLNCEWLGPQFPSAFFVVFFFVRNKGERSGGLS